MSAEKAVYTIEDLRRWPEVTGDLPYPLRLAVIGDPVAHSASPPMHNAALEALGMPIRYTRLHLRPEEVAEAFSLLPKQGFIGINCTIPHKLAALQLVGQVDPAAERAGGVNTVVVREGGGLHGFSTDGPGFARAVQEVFGARLKGLRVLILGAGGGAGRAVAMQCAEAGVAMLTLVNRDEQKLAPLRDTVATVLPSDAVVTARWDEEVLAVHLPGVDLIVNCSALGMKPGDLSPLPSHLLTSRHFVYDTIYTASRTPLMRAADAVGAQSGNGLPMLLHQGALSFEHWFGQIPPIEAMRAALIAAAPK